VSFLGGVLGAVGGFVTGGPAGAVIGGLGGLRKGGGKMPGMMPLSYMPPSAMMKGTKGMTCPSGTACSGPSYGDLCLGSCRTIMPGMMPGTGMDLTMFGRGGACPLPSPRGTHWNKKAYCVGVGSGMPTAIPACSKLIRNRHLNPANGRAALRAVRRIASTHKLLKRIEKSIRRIKGVRQVKLPRQPRQRLIGPGIVDVH